MNLIADADITRLPQEPTVEYIWKDDEDLPDLMRIELSKSSCSITNDLFKIHGLKISII